ncbi:hypothetical protein AB0D65_29220 [Streptomyces griseoloalbus]|uniref:Uncharacterized protein n=1 Tax=Streptomyces griseoloalbus TaxID=67303 RepID=A0ABV3ECT5_9ACTN
MTSPTSAPVPTADADFYAALMSLPYEQWIPAPVAAARVEGVGLPREALRLVIRTGRRRGLLCTKRDPDRLAFYVKRIAETPRPAAATTT